jgi:hypothetical protein
MMPTSEGVSVRAEQVSRHNQVGSAEIRALDDLTLEIRTENFSHYWEAPDRENQHF